MIIPSSVGVMSAPMDLKASVVVSIRFVSLTFNSAASLMIVVPSAQAAMTAIIGISSMSVGINAPSIVVPCSLLVRTRISARGSPPSSDSLTRVMSAPIFLHTSKKPARVLLIPTFFTSSSESKVKSPAAIK